MRKEQLFLEKIYVKIKKKSACLKLMYEPFFLNSTIGETNRRNYKKKYKAVSGIFAFDEEING